MGMSVLHVIKIVRLVQWIFQDAKHVQLLFISAKNSHASLHVQLANFQIPQTNANHAMLLVTLVQSTQLIVGYAHQGY